MPIGNFTYQPKNINKVTLSDIELFILSLLKDVCTQSTNLNLNNCKVNYLSEFNLSDEAINGTVGLLAFFLAENNVSNVNLNARHSDNGDVIKVAYDVGLTTKVDNLTAEQHNDMLQEVINSVTDNYNGGINYQVDINNKILTSPLELNVAADMPQRFLEKESDINYLTSIINIVFTITKET